MTLGEQRLAGASAPIAAAMRGIVLSAGMIRGFPDLGVLCRLLVTSPFAGFPVLAGQIGRAGQQQGNFP